MVLLRLATIATALSLATAAPHFAGRVLPRGSSSSSSYDYVIVGAGAAGLTVANRLTENASVTVLIIEAGPFDKGEEVLTVPGYAGDALNGPYDWNLTYAPSPYVANRSILINLGKVVGGSTKLNKMVFDRGSTNDYARWQALGNTGWGWSDLLPYFEKSEYFTPPNQNIVAEFGVTYTPSVHGYSGNVNSSYAPFFWPTVKNMEEALQELNIPIEPDGEGGSTAGGYYTTSSQVPSNATRCSAREAYYNPVEGRPNLHLITGSQVTRILTKTVKGNVTVTGVEYATSSAGPRSTVSVSKEAILAAGSLHTPQILQVSGIGDPTLLSEIKVDTVVDLPAVGQNLQDHVLLVVVNSITAPLTSNNLTTNATFAAESWSLYETNHTGPYATTGGNFLAFLPLTTFSNESASLYAEASAQNSSAYLLPGTPADVEANYAQQHSLLNSYLLSSSSPLLEIIFVDGLYVLGLEHPYSRGNVKASSSNTFDPPIADPGFLRNPLDLSFLVDAVKFTRVLSSTKAIASLDPVELSPGSSVTSQAALESFVQENVATVWHPVGTCQMGSQANGGVVDEDLRVYGVSGLRVVDASVMPMLPATHIQSTVYAIAEKAADIIKGVSS